MNKKNILECFVKPIIGVMSAVCVLIIMIDIGISTHEIFSGKVSEEEFVILDEISEKIGEGEYPLEELTENDISITLSHDEVKNMYNLEITKIVAAENIYLDDEANIIYIEKQDNSMFWGILGIVCIFLLLAVLINISGVYTEEMVSSLIIKIRKKINMRKVKDKELQDMKE